MHFFSANFHVPEQFFRHFTLHDTQEVFLNEAAFSPHAHVFTTHQGIRFLAALALALIVSVENTYTTVGRLAYIQQIMEKFPLALTRSQQITRSARLAARPPAARRPPFRSDFDKP